MMPQSPLVVTLDVGSSSVRANCFDAGGRALPVECQLEYEPTTTPDGGVEADAERLFDLTARALDGTLAALGGRASEVAAVATSTFWHTVLGVGADGRARTPLYSWADTRSAGAVETLRADLDEKAYHDRTGCVLHTSYLPARLRWLAETDPAAFGASRVFMSFGEYLHLRLFGETRCSVSMASGTGLLDRHAQDWDGPTLDVLGLEPGRFAPLADLDAPFAGLRSEFAEPVAGAGPCPLAPGARRRRLLQHRRRLHRPRPHRPDGRDVGGDARVSLRRPGRGPGRPLVLSRGPPARPAGRVAGERRQRLRVAHGHAAPRRRRRPPSASWPPGRPTATA